MQEKDIRKSTKRHVKLLTVYLLTYLNYSAAYTKPFIGASQRHMFLWITVQCIMAFVSNSNVELEVALLTYLLKLLSSLYEALHRCQFWKPNQQFSVTCDVTVNSFTCQCITA